MKIKKMLSILVSMVMILSFTGCGSDTETGNAKDGTEKSEAEITLSNYEATGTQNVEYVRFLYIGEIDGAYKAQEESAENANYIAVGTICPHCNDKKEYRYEISKVLSEDIGKRTITKTGSGECMGPYHSSSDPSQYIFSYTFTLE